MKIVVAIDSLKGSLSSLEAGEAIRNGIQRAIPEAIVAVHPVADGGEGTVEALVSGFGGELIRTRVSGPLGDPINSTYGILPQTKTAVIEMACTAGLTLLCEREKNPLHTTTRGVGELICDAIKRGCRRFIVGLGGSATNDGGIGMLQALGYGLLDSSGKQVRGGGLGLSTLAEIRTEQVLPELNDCIFRIACDVTNPLCGESGCSVVFAPQKGASREMIQDMDRWMAQYADLVRQWSPNAERSDPEYPGTGAAGGLGYAFRAFMKADLEPGIEIVLDEAHLDDALIGADIVVTGEGRLDGQTVMGKAPIGVARRAKRYGAKVIAFAGSVGSGAEDCNREGIDAFFPILQEIVTLQTAMEPKQARCNMERSAEQVFRLIRTFGL